MKKFTSRILLLYISLTVLVQSVSAAKTLIPGGQIIGIELQDQTVTVAAFDEVTGQSARDSGLQVGDRITKIDKTTITCAEDVRQALTQSNGTVEVHIQRQQESKKLSISPTITSDGPRLGVYLKQGITGVGTVTWYDPETKQYGALGHGVSNQGRTLLQMENGTAFEASILSIKKGRAGTPGQLMGSLNSTLPVGTVTKNTPQGIFGTLSAPLAGQALEVGSSDTVHTGSATIRSTVIGSTPQEYSVEILKIYPASRDGCRNMLLKVTDAALLDATGGIVQGMSGSPIIQDGKLIGAVTHVLVNDPTTGYGIFIENMLDAAA